jgi:hypothetical protein
MSYSSALEPLTAARELFVNELSESLAGFHVTGVTGEAEVGKTALVSAALSARIDIEPVRVDLDAAYSPNRLAWEWARALARATLGGVAFSHIDALPEGAWPARTRSELVRLEDRLGHDIARLVEQSHPDEGVGTLNGVDELMDATITLCSDRQVVLVIDHLEAPSLGFRHPVDVDALLWRIRSASQQAVDLRVVLVARPPAVDLAAGQHAAFYGDGQWLTLRPPSAQQFADATGQPAEVVSEVLSYTAGHIRSTIAVLDRLRRSKSVHAAAAEVAADHVTLADRTLQHAQSLHRLGRHLVLATATGRGPYEATPDARSKEISAAMRQLHMAGIVRRPEDPHADWELTDPRIGWVVTGLPSPLRSFRANPPR